MHEIVAEMLGSEISKYLKHLGCLDDLTVVSLGTADRAQSDGRGTVAADKAWKRRGGLPSWDDQLTLVVEVGWVQVLVRPMKVSWARPRIGSILELRL